MQSFHKIMEDDRHMYTTATQFMDQLLNESSICFKGSVLNTQLLCQGAVHGEVGMMYMYRGYKQ